MKRLALIVAIALPAFAAAEPDALGTLFPLKAPIESGETGLARLELPAAVVRSCRPDFADLRILAADGAEIPYVIDTPEAPGVVTRVRYGVSPVVVDAARSREEVNRVSIHRESFVLEIPSVPADVPAWDLVFTVATREFVGRLDITALDANGSRNPVVTGGAVFRLPATKAEKLRFTLPGREAVHLEVAIESQDHGFLEPRFELEASRFLPGIGASRVELAVLDIRQLGSSTEVLVERPRGFVPRRIEIGATTDTFHRTVTVWDEGPGADPDPLGSASVLRIAAIAPVESLEIPLQRPRGDRLRLVIDNQDSPPLEGIAVTAAMPRPVLVFSLAASTIPPHLYFGGGRAHRPHYDLAALDPVRLVPAAGDAAGTALAILDPARAAIATLGEIERNPSYDPAPVLAFAIHPGAELDPRLYSHHRRLDVAPSAEGLARLRLEPADLAVARPDLADLRIVDREGRQWAYLTQPAAASIVIPVTISGHDIDDRVSSYEIEIPDGPLAVHRVVLEASAPYFDRDFTLMGILEDDRELRLADGRLARRAGDPRPTTIDISNTRVTGFRLEVIDGDDAPLVFGAVEVRTMVPDLYMAAEAGEFDLLLGFPDDRAPVYELERVRSAILAVPAAEIGAQPLARNPDFAASSRLAGSGAAQRIILWSVLGLAVVVLLVLTFRAAGRES